MYKALLCSTVNQHPLLIQLIKYTHERRQCISAATAGDLYTCTYAQHALWDINLSVGGLYHCELKLGVHA